MKTLLEGSLLFVHDESRDMVVREEEQEIASHQLSIPQTLLACTSLNSVEVTVKFVEKKEKIESELKR